MTVHVFGHRNPDTDAICAALAYADLLQRTSRPDAVAASCGPPNQRTEYALRRAGIAAPKIVMDVRPDVIDICHRDLITATENDVFHEVYQRMLDHKIRALPVVSESGKLTGIVQLIELMQLVFQGDQDPQLARRVVCSPDKIRQALNGEYQHHVDVEESVPFTLMVGAMSAGAFTRRLEAYPPETLLVVCGDRPTIQLPALEHRVRMIVVTGGYELSPGLMHLAQLNGVTVVRSPHDTATTTIRIKSARSIEPAVVRNFLTLNGKQSVADCRKLVERAHQSIFPVVDDTGRLKGVLSKSDLMNPPKPQLILVDHNELNQAVAGADEGEILEVLDHHRLGGGLRSTQPIRFINEPVGSTCTLVAKQYRAAGLEPSRGIGLCMASGIISDTLFLRSPTATTVDREALDWLRQFCECELESYAREFFEVGSSLRSHEAKNVVREDLKEFSEQGRKFSISQIEEIGFELFWQRKEDLLSALQDLAREHGLDFSALLVTDLVSNGSLLLMSSEPDYWEAINYPRVDRNLYQLDGVVSRKKQLLPLISQLMESAYG